MTGRFWSLALPFALLSAGPVYAQPNGSRPQSGHAMPGMDMRAMADQCAQMRRQMQPGHRMSPDMQAMMRQCDDMDAQMNGAGEGQAPRPRTR